jgi:DoxX-like family
VSAASHVDADHFMTPVVAPQKWQLWLGRILSALPVLMMMFAGFMKLAHAPQMVASWVNQFGWPERLMTPLALVELSCAFLFAIPRTAVLGAILVTGFFGGAFTSHLRAGDAGGGAVPLALAMIAWLGLYLREERLRPLIPVRRLRRHTVDLADAP